MCRLINRLIVQLYIVETIIQRYKYALCRVIMLMHWLGLCKTDFCGVIDFACQMFVRCNKIMHLHPWNKILTHQTDSVHMGCNDPTFDFILHKTKFPLRGSHELLIEYSIHIPRLHVTEQSLINDSRDAPHDVCPIFLRDETGTWTTTTAAATQQSNMLLLFHLLSFYLVIFQKKLPKTGILHVLIQLLLTLTITSFGVR